MVAPDLMPMGRRAVEKAIVLAITGRIAAPADKSPPQRGFPGGVKYRTRGATSRLPDRSKPAAALVVPDGVSGAPWHRICAQRSEESRGCER